MHPILRFALGTAIAAMAILVWQDSRRSFQTTAGDIDGRVGQAAPEFALPDVHGETVALDAFDGDVVVLDFWALYCRPCIVAMPDVQRLHEAFADEDVHVLSINLDEPGTDRSARVGRFARVRGLSFPMLLDNGTVGWAYGARRIPYVVVIGRDGTIAAVHRGATDHRAVRRSVERALRS